MNKKKELLKIRKTLKLMNQKMSVISREMRVKFSGAAGECTGSGQTMSFLAPKEAAEDPEKE